MASVAMINMGWHVMARHFIVSAMENNNSTAAGNYVPSNKNATINAPKFILKMIHRPILAVLTFDLIDRLALNFGLNKNGI